MKNIIVVIWYQNMTEILSILFHIFFLTVISLFPNKIFFFTKNKDLHIPISIILLSFALLLLSFLSIDLKIVKYFIWAIFFINLFFIFIEKKYLYLNDIKFFFFFLIVLVLSINLSVNLKLGWDAQNYWIIKSLNFVNGDSVYNLKNLPRPEYPYFGSYLWAVFSSISFLGHEYFGRIFYIYLFCASLFSICNLIDYKNNIKILSFLVLIIIFNNDFIFQGYQEVLIFSYAVFASYLIYEFRNSLTDTKIITLILINFFIMFWIKNEAFIFSLIFIACILFYVPQKKIYFLIGLVLMVFFRIYLFKIFNFDLHFQSGNYEKIDTSYLIEIISVDRILTIMKYSIFSLFKMPIVILVIISGIITFALKKHFIFKLFATNLFGGLLLFFLAYLSTTFPLAFHMVTSADRLLFQIVGLNIILIVILMNQFKIKKLF